MAQRLKCLPPMQEIWVQSLGQEEEPLEKEMVTHSSILAWRIPWTEKPGSLQFTGSRESDMTERLHFPFHFHALEKEMATHSNILAWRIPGTGEPAGLLSMGLQSQTRLK